MKADPLSIGKILSERQRFVVPIYQRTFGWTVRDQIEPFFEQIKSKASERIKDGKVAFAHYMGALLLIPEGEPVFGQIQVFDVVDGQQRLTTFHLCIAALRDLALDHGFDDLAATLGDLIIHAGTVPMRDAPSDRYKLQPTAYDRESFRDLIDLRKAEIQQKYATHFFQNGKIKGSAPEAISAYWFFWREAESFIGRDSDGAVPAADDQKYARQRLLALSTSLFEDFRLIVITLTKDDDPQVIFETLNSGGKPLAAMDLVRNDVFHRAERCNENQDYLYENYWSVFEDSFWKQEQTQGRIRKPRIDFFLAHALTVERGRSVALGELYAEYKATVAAIGFPSIAAELAALIKHVPTYRALIEPEGDNALARLGRRLNVFDVSTAYPLVFVIAALVAPEAVKDTLYELIASYIIRRAICYLPPNNYNNIFADAAAYLMEHGASLESFAIAFADEKATTTRRFPSDADLRDAILTRPQYNWMPRSRLRLLLQELEFASRDKFNVNGTLQEGLQVEHVMPQQWQMAWPLPSGRLAPPDLVTNVDEEMRKEIDHRQRLNSTFGNLTLLTPPANASASNGSFASKRVRLQDSLLKMNTDLAALPGWTEDAIQQRSARLADLGIRLWPAITPAAEKTQAEHSPTSQVTADLAETPSVAT